MIDLIISATVGAIAGSAIMRRIDLRKIPSEVVVSEIVADRDWWKNAHNDGEDFWQGAAKLWDAERDELKATLVSLADASLAKQSRIDRALACETPKAAHGVKKMARLLRGEEA